ncbi:MAG: antibiotic biosynthesis monooxygenase [Myxococcaceae bacterium]|nr:antibiotic biosynthesis monooxygenase [Myxococcaceae bacterium]
MKARESSGGRVMTALLAARPEKQEELLQTLRSLAVEIQNQPGCTTCVLGQDVAGGPRFVLYLAWKDLASMEAGMSAEPFRVLLGASSTLSGAGNFSFSVANAAPSPLPAKAAP